MSVISGTLQKVNGQSTVARWFVNYFGEPPEFLAANTSGGVSEACGVSDWKGYYEAYGHTPGVFPGEALALIGDLGNTKGVSGTAIVDEIIITADIERSIPFKYRVNFSRNGALTRGDATATDSTTPAIYCPTSLTVVRDGEDVDNCRFWRLLIGARNKPYVDSSSDGGRLRIAGPIYGQWLYRCYLSDPSTLPEANDTFAGQFEVTDSTYWSVSYCKVHEVQQLGADSEGEENVGAIVSGAFVATYGTLTGSIETPAGVEKWPAA